MVALCLLIAGRPELKGFLVPPLVPNSTSITFLDDGRTASLRRCVSIAIPVVLIYDLFVWRSCEQGMFCLHVLINQRLMSLDDNLYK